MMDFDIRVEDSLFDPDSTDRTQVRVRKESGNQDRYKVYLFLDGYDLELVAGVTYYLHESFKTPERYVNRTSANPHCKLVLWTWGVFDVRAAIRDVKGNTLERSHYLSYDNWNELGPEVAFLST